MKILKKLEDGRIIVDYDPALKQSFIDINLAWIKKYFVVEKDDVAIFTHVEDLLAKKSRIFFMLNPEGQVINTVLLEPKEEHTMEFCKFGANENLPHKNSGNQMLSFVFEFAKDNDIRKLTIITNTILTPAIHLYEKYGFVIKDIPLEYRNFERGNLYLEWNETK